VHNYFLQRCHHMEQGVADGFGYLVAFRGRKVRIHRDMKFRLLPMSQPADTDILDRQNPCNSRCGLFDPSSLLRIDCIHQPVPEFTSAVPSHDLGVV